MRWIANYLRQVFCAHQFEREEYELAQYTEQPFVEDHLYRRGTKVALFCPKCGFNRSFWK